MSHLFINRPIFAMVLSIIITLGGAVAVFTLPIAQYPEIVPPTISVTANYPGASADVVADTIAAPIEQQVNGVENMLYMYSQSGNDGSYTLNVTFKLGVDLNIAQVLVQNRYSQPLEPLRLRFLFKGWAHGSTFSAADCKGLFPRFESRFFQPNLVVTRRKPQS